MTAASPTVVVALRPSGELPPCLVEKAGELARFVPVRSADELGDDDLDARAVFVWNFRSTLVPDAVERLKALEWVHVAASGVDASLSDAVRERAPAITNSRGVTADAMAEYALAMMLTFAKDLRVTLADQTSMRWRPRLSRMLSGACLVTVGVGAVNQSLARRATALGMRVVGVGRSAHQEMAGFERVVSRRELCVVLPAADYVVAATPRTGETEGMIGSRELSAMSPGAVLVNIGRGAVVDEDSLLDALRTGRIGGAALDVTWREPLEPDHELWSMPNVLLSPHMSSDFVGWEDAMVDLFVDNLRRWCTGRALVNVVDPDLGYTPSEGAVTP